MKKVFAFLFAALMLCTLAACGGDPQPNDSSDPQTGSSMEDAPSATVSVTPSKDTATTSSTSGSTTVGRTRSTATTSTVTRPVVTDWEKPVTYNTAIVYNEKHSSYDGAAEKMRLSIVNSKSVVGPSEVGKTYYVSPKGHDDNDGLSPSTAWRTLDKLQLTGRFSTGDVVLFERGAVYRGTIPMVSGVSYGAYGVGAKPAIYGSPQNYADPALWEKTDRENVWLLKVDSLLDDIGNIVFDHGKVCASDGKRLENTLTKDFQFHHDAVRGYVYLYLSKGNPGELYGDIEVCPKEHIMGPSVKNGAVSNVKIDNLCIKYGGAHGIVFGTAENITITNCEVGYIGGSMMNVDVRYGNGIEFNSHVTNARVENNWIYQCFDAGYTNQGRGARHTDLLVKNNLIEYCNYNIEIYGSYVAEDGTIKGLLKNCLYEGNVLRFAGYGFGTKNRIGSNDSAVAAICYWRSVIPSENVVIRSNILDTSYRYLLVSAYVNDQRELAPIVKGNTWIQHDGPKSAVALQVDTDKVGWVAHYKYELSSKGLDKMKESVAKVDTAPVKVLYEG